MSPPIAIAMASTRTNHDVTLFLQKLDRLLGSNFICAEAGKPCPKCGRAKLKARTYGKTTRIFCPKCEFSVLTAPACFVEPYHSEIVCFLERLSEFQRRSRENKTLIARSARRVRRHAVRVKSA